MLPNKQQRKIITPVMVAYADVVAPTISSMSPIANRIKVTARLAFTDMLITSLSTILYLTQDTPHKRVFYYSLLSRPKITIAAWRLFTKAKNPNNDGANQGEECYYSQGHWYAHGACWPSSFHSRPEHAYKKNSNPHSCNGQTRPKIFVLHCQCFLSLLH